MSLSLEIETPRLVLRQWLAADRKPFADMNTDARVTRYLLPMTAQESDALADRLAAGIDEYGWGFWAVEAPGVAPFIGFVGIKALAPTLPFAPGVEIGWRLAGPYWGQGLCQRGGAGRAAGGVRTGRRARDRGVHGAGKRAVARGDAAPGHA